MSSSTITYFTKDLAKTYLDEVTKMKETDGIYSYPLVYTSDKPNSTTVIYPSKNGLLSYQYKNLSADKKTIKTIVKYFYYKILDKWIYRDLMSLLAFISMDEGMPKIITDLADYNPRKITEDSIENIEKRIDYMEKILINKDMVRHVLKKVLNRYKIGWYELKDYEDEIKKYFFKYIREKLEDAISNVH